MDITCTHQDPKRRISKRRGRPENIGKPTMPRRIQHAIVPQRDADCHSGAVSVGHGWNNEESCGHKHTQHKTNGILQTPSSEETWRLYRGRSPASFSVTMRHNNRVAYTSDALAGKPEVGKMLGNVGRIFGRYRLSPRALPCASATVVASFARVLFFRASMSTSLKGIVTISPSRFMDHRAVGPCSRDSVDGV